MCAAAGTSWLFRDWSQRSNNQHRPAIRRADLKENQIMKKEMILKVIAGLKAQLGSSYESIAYDIHSDFVDTAAYRVADDLGLDEDDVRFYGNLPRL